MSVVAGCSGEQVDLGPGETATPPSLEGTWTATLSSAAFVASPKPLRLVLDASGQGTLLVGADPLVPPTDPAVGSPPEADADTGQATGLLLHLYAGVEYSLIHVKAAPDQLQFELDALEAFAPVCSIQIPISTDIGYRCLPNLGGGVDRSGGSKQCYMGAADGDQKQDVDCLMLYLCSIDPQRGCRCTDSSCSTSDGGNPVRARFVLSLSDDGTTLSGTLGFSDAGGGDLTGPDGDSVTFTREAD